MSRAEKRRSIPLAAWPQQDRDAWAAALRPADLFAPGPRPQDNWAKRTIEGVRGSYGRWLQWLAEQGTDIHLAGPAERASPDTVQAYYRSMIDRGLADVTVAQALIDLARALTMLAPDKDWSWVAKAGHRVQATAEPRMPKPTRRATDTLALGHDLMRAAEEDRHRSELERGVLYRDGLIIAFLTHRPLRLANLAGLDLGRHIRRVGEAHWVTIPGCEVKNKREASFAWPSDLQPHLDLYLDKHRPRLLLAGSGRRKAATDALWVSRRGAAYDYGALTSMVANRTLEAFGERISPHKFRHIAATTIATETPDAMTDAARILGHATLATTETYYNQARTADAAGRYQTLLRERGKT